MDILLIAEENFLVTFAFVLGIGLLQGAILGRGIRNRFPSLKRHAKAVSGILLALFSINAVANIVKFATPEKVSLSDLNVPSNLEGGFSVVIDLLGLNAGLGTVIAMFVSITIILVFRFAQISAIPKYFIFGLSVIVVAVAFLARFTDFIPSVFQVVLYAFYQFGITLGIFLVTRRKDAGAIPEFE